jgi:hypothetical protein
MNGYIYIWQYDVNSEHESDFVKAYNSGGEWVDLFRKAKGYIRTEFLRDASNPLRFITIDYWDSVESRNKFMDDFSQEFNDMDSKCEKYTSKEIKLGDYFQISE